MVTDTVFAGLQQAEDVDPTWVSLRVDQVPTSETIEIDGIAWDLHADPKKPERRLVAEVDGSTVVLTTTGDHAVLEDLALSLIHISEPTRRTERSRMPSSA